MLSIQLYPRSDAHRASRGKRIWATNHGPRFTRLIINDALAVMKMLTTKKLPTRVVKLQVGNLMMRDTRVSNLTGTLLSSKKSSLKISQVIIRQHRAIRPQRCKRSVLGALDFLQHLEHTFRCIDKQTLEGLAKASALERIAAHTFTFSHEILQSEDRYSTSFRPITVNQTIQ